MSGFVHLPVLAREVAGLFRFGDRPARLIDGTLGNGGHSRLLLEENPGLEIIGIDRDAGALERAERELVFTGKRVKLERAVFSELARVAEKYGWEKVDGILLDVGVSSPQLDDPARGFSWRADGPLDMRMDQSEAMTASRLLNRADEAELERIFREYGEVKRSRLLARAVVEARARNPFAVTGDLVAVCDAVLGKSRPGKLPSPTLPFQGLRIAVNDELGELERALAAAVELLDVGGRLAVISFHSLEDRLVKRFFRECAAECVCPPGLPVCRCGKQATLKILTRKALTAGPDELAANRRAAPARLRAAQKI